MFVRERLELESVQQSRRVYRLMYIICEWQKVRKISEPRAGFDLRKRTIGDAFSEGLPIGVWRATVHDEPMHHTGRAVFLTLDMILDSIKGRS